MAKTVIKQRGTNIKERKQSSKQTENFWIEYTIQESLEIFLKAKVAEGLRDSTLVEYNLHIKYLASYLTENHPSFNYIRDLTPSLIRDYVTYLKNKKA